MYGLYLTLSSWVLFHVATKTHFFEEHLHMFSLNTRQSELRAFCTNLINDPGVAEQYVCREGAVEQYHVQSTCQDGTLNMDRTVLQQCVTEQLYVRDSMTRALMYDQVRAGSVWCGAAAEGWAQDSRRIGDSSVCFTCQLVGVYLRAFAYALC